jgi:hypothetical protein
MAANDSIFPRSQWTKYGSDSVHTAQGGIPELIDARDWDRCLFDPNAKALAEKLREVLSAEF